MSSQLSVRSKLCIMNTLLYFLLLFQFCRSLRNITLGDCILGKSNVIITVGWLRWRHQSAPLFSLASPPPNPKPTTGHDITHGAVYLQTNHKAIWENSNNRKHKQLLKALHTLVPAPDCDGGLTGAQAWWKAPRSDAEFLDRGWLMKSLGILRIVYIYDVTLWRHIR